MADPDPNAERLKHRPEAGVRRYAHLYPGYEECPQCKGDGTDRLCAGSGTFEGKPCHNCIGSGRCWSCNGAGQQRAPSTEAP